MSLKSTPTKYGGMAVIFHWFSALLIISMIPLGMIMHEMAEGATKENLYRVHLVIGLLVFATTLARLVWRYIDSTPDEIENTPKIQSLLTKIVHYGLYAFIIIASVSGMSFTILSGLGEQLFMANMVIWPNAHDFTPATVHGIITKLLALFLIGHVVAAIYHQHVVKDGIMKRMSFKK